MQNIVPQAIKASHALAQGVLRGLYPPHCLTCDELVEEHGAFCARCWPEVAFIDGTCCDSCGLPLPGQSEGSPIHCDECLTLARPWDQGRAVMLYAGRARQIVLGLKHHDRQDLARPAARWMARVAAPLIRPDMLVAPIPLHWLRFALRRYNQAALLSSRLARELSLAHCPDLLLRCRATGSQDGRGRMGRFANVADAFEPHPRHVHKMAGRDILLVDDVMTAGATFAAAAETCLAHGAASVRVLALARVARAQ